MKQNFFKTLGDALEAVRQYLIDSRAVLADADGFFNPFNYGGVQYGETKSRLGALATVKDKPTRKGLSLSIYRMESGTYEAVAYIA